MFRSRPAEPRALALGHALAALDAAGRDWAARASAMRAVASAMRAQIREAARAEAQLPALRALAAAAATKKKRVARPRPTWRGPPHRAPRGQGTGSVAVAILREWGRPARVGEILVELEKRAVKVGGKSPYNT